MTRSVWAAIVAWLVWLSSDPTAIDREHPRAAAAVAAARASMLVDSPVPPSPEPTECGCGETCVRGIWRPDGRIEQRCDCDCDRCQAERARP